MVLPIFLPFSSLSSPLPPRVDGSRVRRRRSISCHLPTPRPFVSTLQALRYSIAPVKLTWVNLADLGVALQVTLPGRVASGGSSSAASSAPTGVSSSAREARGAACRVRRSPSPALAQAEPWRGLTAVEALGRCPRAEPGRVAAEVVRRDVGAAPTCAGTVRNAVAATARPGLPLRVPQGFTWGEGCRSDPGYQRMLVHGDLRALLIAGRASRTSSDQRCSASSGATASAAQRVPALRREQRRDNTYQRYGVKQLDGHQRHDVRAARSHVS